MITEQKTSRFLQQNIPPGNQIMCLSSIINISVEPAKQYGSKEFKSPQ